MKTTAGILIAAKSALLRRGWYQGDYALTDGDERDGPVCAYGAINVAISGDPFNYDLDTDKSHRALSLLRKAIGTGMDIPHWNDNELRQPEEILDAFDRAIALALADEVLVAVGRQEPS